MKTKVILSMVVVLAILGSIYFFVNRANQTIVQTYTPRPYVWDFEMDYLQHIVLSLPRENLSESFVKHEDRLFYFDVENGPKVDMQRWGGGIPLLLSGPGSERIIADNVTDAQLTEYGFDNPSLTAVLTLDDGTVYEIEVGDSNPSGTTYYTRLIGNNKVYIVDKSWYEVISGIVSNPPYVPATFTVERPTVSQTEISAGGTVIITVQVTNEGDLPGSYDVNLKINSEVVQTKTVTLEAHASEALTFSVTEDAVGTYVASVDARTVTFVVK
ncbi:MAG: DUF4340 domain-containing protein [Dehalococcoidales bacterium]|nr:DUF4340 domain-containing protein [Dehalococcoidales bacterium]